MRTGFFWRVALPIAVGVYLALLFVGGDRTP